MNTNSNEEIKMKIESCIDRVKQKFKEKPDIYLTENDIKCHLFSQLKQCQEFSQEEKTLNGGYSIPIHTEVRWYGKSGKLRYRSDIVIMDVGSLKVKDKYNIRLPSKGYSFNMLKAIIEIKLRRKDGETNNEFVKSIRKEIERLEKIKEKIKLSDDFPLYLLIFDKKNNIPNEISKIQGITSVNTKYIYSNF